MNLLQFWGVLVGIGFIVQVGGAAVIPPSLSRLTLTRGGTKDEVHTSARSSSFISKMWPPWPLSLIRRSSPGEVSGRDFQNSEIGTDVDEISVGALAWMYLRQRARLAAKQCQEVSSQVWFHLPPASPPLLLFACLPRSRMVTVIQDGTSVEVSRRVFPVVSNPFARGLVLGSLGLAVLSWSNQELARKRKLTALPFESIQNQVSRVLLPPVLPPEVDEPEIEALQSVTLSNSSEDGTLLDPNGAADFENTNTVLSRLSPRIRKQLQGFYETASQPQRNVQYYFNEWRRRRNVRKREVAKIKRMSTFDELVALQALKRKAVSAAKGKQRSLPFSNLRPILNDQPTSWALVTGASSGIGRALAVELARWEIPVILVARDVQKLWRLAEDLQVCYGVKCCVLGVDLSQPDSAEQVYKATKASNMEVEILCNNAGIAFEGLTVDVPMHDSEKMVNINCLTMAKLAQLYGKDMKDRRRGRILFVSSMAGLSSANPNVSVYGATKAFGKSLSLAMAKELEAYGVGVTCLLPGAVKNTNFRESTPNSLCWRIPFYPRPAESVAHQGIMSLFDGDAQVIPGFQNRLFANLVRPIIPQRFEIMCTEAAFGPTSRLIPRIIRKRFDTEGTKIGTENNGNGNSTASSTEPAFSSLEPNMMGLLFEPRYKIHAPPKVLRIPDVSNMLQKGKEQSSVENSNNVTKDTNDHDGGELERGNGAIDTSFNSLQNVTSISKSSPGAIKRVENITVGPSDPIKVNSSQATFGNVQKSSDPSDQKSSDPQRQEQRSNDNNEDVQGLGASSYSENTSDVVGQEGQRHSGMHETTSSPSHSYDEDLMMSPSLGPVDIMDHNTSF